MKKINKSIFIGILSLACACCTVGAFAFSANNAVVVEAATTATVNKMNFEEGASVRTTPENMGIRFTANYDTSIYELVESGAGTAGMIIVPEKALAGATGDYFNYLQTNFGKSPASVSTEFTVDYFTENKDGTYQARGAIVNLLDDNLVYDYQAVAYYYTEASGYVYSGKSDSRTISYVTNAALQDDDLTEQQRADTLKMATVLSARLETLNKASSSDFSIQTTPEKGLDLSAYVSKDKTIASVTLNGVSLEITDNQIALTESQASDSAQVLKITYSDNSTLSINVMVNEAQTIETDVTIYMGISDAENTLTAEQVFGEGTEYAITSIKDENGKSIAYENGVVTLPEGLTAGTEYTWTVSNGKDKYLITVFVATNVIRTTDDLNKFFNYSDSNAYYTTGASGYYVLANNIDASGYTHTHGMTNSSGVGLTGTFDGRGYTIDGITLTNAGLFGYVKGGTIKNVALTNVTVQTTGEAYVITQQSSGMTIDNVFVDVTYSAEAKAWNQGLFEKAWGKASVSNVMVVAKGGNANAFVLGAMWNNQANYTYTNVYAISELSAVRLGESAGVTIYADVDTFKANVTTSNLTNFNEYWDLTSKYPRFKSMPKIVNTTFYYGLEDAENRLTAEQVFGEGTEYAITSIKDENGKSIAYENGVVTLPEGLTAGTEYTWTVSNGKDKYLITVFVATNVIRTTDDLNKFFNYSDSNAYYTTGASGYYVLANNIDASGYTHTHGMTNSSGVGLTGTFDGRGYTIDGITLTNAGLFGYVSGGTIKNVALTNVTVQTTGEAYVITQQSFGMTIDNVFVDVTYSAEAKAWNQGLFEKAWGKASVSNVMVVAKGGNANAFVLGAMWNNQANYTYTNVYAISELSAVRLGESAGVTIYADVDTFKANVTTSNLTNFNEYWDLTGAYPEFESVPNVFEVDTTFYFGVEDAQNTLTAEEVFGTGTEDVIVSIKDENGATIAYNNGVITLPEGLTAGTEYTWTVSNGIDKYIINVFVATNVIRTTEDLNKYFNYSEATDYYTTGASGYYVLANNIDASGYTHTHGMKNSSGQGLTGTFDGRGYTIDGITLTNAGLFGYVKGGTIKNVALTNVNMQSTDEAYVITQQSAGMTIDNVYVGVTYAPQVWNQGMFEKPWGAVTVSNVMVVATGGNENTFALGAMWDRETNYTYTNVYVISELSAVRLGESAGVTIYADALTFATNVDVSALTNFNEYWDLTGAYPVFTSGLEYENGELYEGVHLYSVRESDEKIVENGETEYKIVRADNATTYEINAIYELEFFFAKATGIHLDIVYDSDVAYSPDAKYISIGETNYATDAGVIAEYSLLKSGGFRIVTVENSIIIKGASDRGTLYGVYEFLAQCFNYEYFSDTAIRIETDVTDLALMDFDVTDVPDFEYNLATYGYVHGASNETVRRYRMLKDGWLIIPVGSNKYHNSFDWFPKETYYANHNKWYSTDGQQLCYTAQGDAVEYAAMLETATQTAKALLSDPAYLEYNVLTLTQQDGLGWCKCDTCTATAEQYNGSNAAVVIHFLNDLKTNIDEWFLTDGAEYSRDLKLLFFGYHQTNKPPTIYNEATGKHELVDSSVKCISGVGVFFAETDGDYTQDFFAEPNREIANNMVGYGCVTEDIFFWSYQTNFAYYLTPYNSFDCMQSIYQYAKYNNACVLFDQGQYNEVGKATGWAALKVYLNSKLSWNVNADMDTLIDEFFISYFGPAATYMREMFDSYIVQARYNSANEGYTGEQSILLNALQTSFWPEELLNNWISYTDEALNSIDYLKTLDADAYNAYSENIRRERISALYLLIELYGSNLDSTILQSYKITFYNDAQELGLTKVDEKISLETLYTKWGLQ